MGQLPFLIEYGGWVWPIAGASFVVSWLLLRAVHEWWSWRKERLLAQRALGPRVELDAMPDGQIVAVSGVLQLDGEPILPFQGGEPAAACSAEGQSLTAPRFRVNRTAELVLDTGSRRVRLVGPMAVLAGSHESRPLRKLRKLPAAADVLAELVDAPPTVGASRVVFRTLRAGDPARVAGVLSRQASPETGGYRQAAMELVLSPPDGEGSSLVAAHTGAVTRGRRSPRRLAQRVVAPLLVFFAAGWLAGALALEREWPARTKWQMELAAATPFHRRKAVSAYEQWLWRKAPTPGIVLERTKFLSCRAASAELLVRGQLDRARAFLVDCHDPQAPLLRAMIDVAGGRYAAASDSLATLPAATQATAAREAIGAHLAAHRYDRALAVARAWNAAEPTPGGDCLVAALQYRSGDPKGLETLRELAARPLQRRNTCILLALDLDTDTTLASRIAAKSAVAVVAELVLAERDPRALAALLGRTAEVFYGDYEREYLGQSPFARYRNEEMLLPIGLVESARRRLAVANATEEVRAYRNLLTWRLALFADRAGDKRSASDYLDEARTLPLPRATMYAESLLAIQRRGLAGARTACPKRDGADPCWLLEDADEVRRGKSSALYFRSWQLTDASGFGDARVQELTIDASQGSGRALAALLSVSRERGRWPLLAEFCPTLASDRRAVGDALAWAEYWDDSESNVPATPRGWFEAMSRRYAYAQMCGLDRLAGALEPAMRAHYRSSLDRETAVFFSVLEEM